MNQLDQDLMKNARHRLNLWIKDTTMRCDVVDMPDVKQAALIMSVLVDAVTEAAVSLRMDREEFAYMICQCYDDEVKIKTRNVKEKP